MKWLDDAILGRLLEHLGKLLENLDRRRAGGCWPVPGKRAELGCDVVRSAEYLLGRRTPAGAERADELAPGQVLKRLRETREPIITAWEPKSVNGVSSALSASCMRTCWAGVSFWSMR